MGARAVSPYRTSSDLEKESSDSGTRRPNCHHGSMSVITVRKSQDQSLQGEKRSIGVPPEQGETIVDALFANASRHPDRPAMRRHPADRPTSGEWEVVTWAEYLLAARRIAGGRTKTLQHLRSLQPSRPHQRSDQRDVRASTSRSAA